MISYQNLGRKVCDVLKSPVCPQFWFDLCQRVCNIKMATVLVLVLSRGHKHSQGKNWLKSYLRFLLLTSSFLSCCDTAEGCKSFLTRRSDVNDK